MLLTMPVSGQSENSKPAIEIGKNELQDLSSKKPLEYQDIDKLLYSIKQDSTKLKKIIDLCEKNDFTEIESYALNALGAIYRNISAYDKAIEVHTQAIKKSEEAKNLELQIISLNNMGVVYRRMDFAKKSLDYHAKALELARTVEKPSDGIEYSIAVSYNSMGNIYLILKQYDLALKQFQKSLAIEKKSGNSLGLAINYQNIGYAYEQQGIFENALRNYKRSLNYNNQIDSELGRVICYNSIGSIYIKQGKFNDAKTLIRQALQKAIKLKDQFYISTSYINMGWVEMELENLIAAEDFLLKGLKSAEDYNLRLSIVEANKKLSELYAQQNENALALNHFKKSIELEKEIDNRLDLKYMNDVIIQFENESKNKEIQALADENEIVRSKLERNKVIFWYSMLALGIIAAIMIALYRNRQLKQEKHILTLEQDMLRNQMNPHFIFNSLNSIKLYIINNEKENAVYYLNKFSKLIRKILVASTDKEISLEDELETMSLYMNIENIRFSNEIIFTIDVDENVNTSRIKLPSMVLQPFLENSLWHGLSSKKETDKQINIHVYKKSNDFVTIAIEDNGVGRYKSREIKHGKLLKRKSVGIDLTKARLANFAKNYTNDYSLSIEDLYDQDQKPRGTKVILNIPIRSSVLRTA